MADLHLRVPDYVVEQINQSLRAINGAKADLSIADIAKEALAVYKWTLEQMASGRSVGAADETARIVVQVATPSTPVSEPNPKRDVDVSDSPILADPPAAGPRDEPAGPDGTPPPDPRYRP